MATKTIGWGKCSIIVRDIDGGGNWIKVATPKEDTTSLETTAGDELTADIEGGDFEDIKFGPSSYELSFSIRTNTERKKPLTDVNGVISNHVAVFVQPENSACPGVYIPYSMGHVEESFDTTDGGMWTYTFKALPSETYTQKIFWATCSVDLLSVAEGTEYDTSALTLTNLEDSTTLTQITASEDTES